MTDAMTSEPMNYGSKTADQISDHHMLRPSLGGGLVRGLVRGLLVRGLVRGLVLSED